MKKIFIPVILLYSFYIYNYAQTKNLIEYQYKTGITQRAFIPTGNYNWRGAKTHALITIIWYPADSSSIEEQVDIGSPGKPIATAGRASKNAHIISGKQRFPLILLSHGTGGSALMMAWLGTELAKNGYIAAAVNHPGNNALEDYNPQGFSLWWERAVDLSTVINRMISDSAFGPRIDTSRIGAVGFSLGGYTMIEIAGGITDPDLFSKFCEMHPDNSLSKDPPEFPGLTQKVSELMASDSVYRESLNRAENSYRDKRIKAVFAIAPALGPAFKPGSLKRISIPVEIIAGAADTIVPISDNAKFFKDNIPASSLNIIPGAVGHYTFLAKCTDFGREVIPSLCIDPPGVNREAVHEKTVKMVLEFFKNNLKGD